MINWRKTERGFGRGEFKDRYDSDCSIQVSSIATEDCIWLGQDKPTYDNNGRFCGCRMHLTREMAGELAEILKHFHDTGELIE